MKELSIEQKAKRYDEAIEALRSLFSEQAIKHCDRVYIKDITNIFHELEESEDERTWIINYLSNRILNSTIIAEKENLKKAIAWLEAQGEHANFRNKIQIGDKVTRNKDGMLVNLSQLKRVAKPADNVEPSIFKDRLLELFQIFRWRCKDHILTNGEILEYVDAHIQEHIGTMQKPTDTEKGAKGNDREIPNSAWSEEDEARFESCIEVLQTSDGYDTINAKWLKSLKDRYTWKPSDEQLKALKEAVDEHFDIDGGALWHLYEDLKKLREE